MTKPCPFFIQDREAGSHANKDWERPVPEGSSVSNILESTLASLDFDILKLTYFLFESLGGEYRPHPHYTGIVQVRDDFSILRSMVVGDAG